MKQRITKRKARHKRVRSRIKGTSQRPRFFVFKSNQHIYASLIDDITGTTLLAVSDKNVVKKGDNTLNTAHNIGEIIAALALKKGYKKVVFDRGGYIYHGKVRALAEGARAKGLVF